MIAVSRLSISVGNLLCLQREVGTRSSVWEIHPLSLSSEQSATYINLPSVNGE